MNASRHATDTVTYDTNRWDSGLVRKDLLKGFDADLPTLKTKSWGMFSVRTVWFRKDGDVTILTVEGDFFLLKRSQILSVQPGTNRSVSIRMWGKIDQAFNDNRITLL